MAEKNKLVGKSILKTLKINLSKSQKSRLKNLAKSKNYANLTKS